MKFRKMVISDKTDFINMSRKFFHSPAVLHSVSDEVIESNFEMAMEDNNLAGGYIFEEGNEIVGYAFLVNAYSTEVGGFCVWLEELFVEDAYRNKGIGRSFLDFLEKNNSKIPVRIRFEVEPSNEGALRLYEKLGYERLEYIQFIKDFC